MARTTIVKNAITDEAGKTVSASGNLAVFNLDLTSEAFAIQVYCDTTSVGAEITINLEFSLDGKNYTAVISDLVIEGGTSPDTTIIFDFPSGTGASFARISAEVVSGSTVVRDILLKGKSSR